MKFEETHAGREPSPYGLPIMNLRDYFAAQALSGIASALHSDVPALSENITAGRVYARAAYALADAMLAERSKA